jgi:hypothetical protein
VFFDKSIESFRPLMKRARVVFKLIENSPFKKTDPPEITLENPIVYSGEGQEAILSCIVHGETTPQVNKDRNLADNSREMF